MLVRDIMTRTVITINQNKTLLELINLMEGKNLRRIPVVNDAGQVVGIVTDKDVRGASPSEASTLDRYEANYLLSRIKVKDIMVRNVKTVVETSGIEDVALIMYKDRIASLPVLDEGNNLSGIVTDTDVFRALVGFFGLGQPCTRITLDCTDKTGVVADLGKMFADQNINIISFVTTEFMEGARREITISADLSAAGMDIIEKIREAGYDVKDIITVH